MEEKRKVHVKVDPEVNKLIQETELEEKKDILTSLLYDGYYSETVTVGDTKFQIRTLSMAELDYADRYAQRQIEAENLPQMSATRLVRLAYLAMSFLNPYKAAGANNTKDILAYLHGDSFAERYNETVLNLSIKPQAILDYLYQKYTDIAMKAMRILEPPAGLSKEDYLKN